MKSKKSKKNIKISIVFLSALLIISTGLILLFNYISGNTSNKFTMKTDDDKSFYCKNYLSAYNYLSYYNGELYAKNFYRNTLTSYSPDSKDTYSINSNARLLNKNLFYISFGTLYCKSVETNEKEVIDTGCKYFVLNNNAIIYTKDNEIFIKDINTFELINVINVQNEIYYLDIIDNYLYLIEYTEAKKTNTASLVLDRYDFYKYDINTAEILKSTTGHFNNHIQNITVCDDKFFYYYIDTYSIHSLDLDKEKSMSPIINYDIVDIVSNGEDVFYLSEKTESEIIRKTVDCETNGIWKIDAENYTVSKVSDKCSFENILATKNYVYCYKIEYVFPRGVANSWAKGFSIEQIAI